MHWNWGAGSGVVDGRVVGVQVGGRWTDGTGSTENALVVDGRVHKISEELAWDYDPADWLAPWRVHGELADLTFTPFHGPRLVDQPRCARPAGRPVLRALDRAG